MPGDWINLTGAEAAAVPARLRSGFKAVGLGDGPGGIVIQGLRRAPLVFYRDCALVDILLQRPGSGTVLVSPHGAALLDGGSPLIHAINPDLLALDGDKAAGAMEGDQPIASDLPVRVRRYEGILRTPRSETATG